MEKGRSLRARLLLFLSAFLVPTLVAAAAAIYYIGEQKQRQFELGLRETTRALSQVVEQELSRREAIARTLAESPTITRGDLAGFHVYASQIAPTSNRVVVLTDLAGQQVVNTRRPFGSQLPHSSRPRSNPEDPDAALVSDIYFAPIGKQWSFAVHVPVKRDGRTIYRLSYASYASLLQTLFEKQPLPRGWVASIADSKGVVAARNVDAEKWVGKPLSEGTRARMQAGQEAIYESVSIDGRPVLASFYRGAGDWAVLIGVPLSDFAAANNAALAFWLFAAAALSAAVFAVIWFGRRLVVPVDQLADAARKLGRGDPVSLPRSGITELDFIGDRLEEADKSLAAARHELEDRVRSALAEAEKAQRAVVQNQRMEALGQLTGGVAHDFNNLLMVVGNYAHLLRRTVPGLTEHPHLQGIERAVATGARLTRQLLAFARRQPLRPQILDVADRIPELAALVKASVGSSIQVECETRGEVPAIYADPAEFELAVINLAVNSRDAMPDGGRLRITASVAELRGHPAALIEVADTGSGMSPETVARAFEPFFTTKEVGRGTGLGLSQVYGFAQQAGGEASVESTQGKGTAVRILLPAADGRPAGASAEEGDASAASRPAEGTRILLVEDNVGLARPTAELLQNAGYEVELAASGDAAIELLQTSDFDAVLSDIRMPGANDGIALAGWIRQNRPGLRIVLMTGYTSELAQAENLGVPVLAKPAPAASLLRAVAEAAGAST